MIVTLNLCLSGKILVDKVHRSPILPFRVLDWPKDTDTDVSSCDNIYIKLQFLKRFIPNEQRMSSIQLHISQIFQNNKILNSFNSRYTQKCDYIE